MTKSTFISVTCGQFFIHFMIFMTYIRPLISPPAELVQILIYFVLILKDAPLPVGNFIFFLL